ncbi:hypothetical protein L596_000131 [Steinernema carpocapsae]|uniref:Uncharacterized protein n=1 Tax=Steinernema carpocapsae TaxID=34508 RepID=A0A4U8UJN0_STECR|nr:hypothetical protein L596_000131 [Steinernema carpocapsae]
MEPSVPSSRRLWTSVTSILDTCLCRNGVRCEMSCRQLDPFSTYSFDSCQVVNVCLGNKIHSKNHQCPENSQCGIVNHRMGCVCDPGYQLDSYKKECPNC